jgi:hypothetical protein
MCYIALHFLGNALLMSPITTLHILIAKSNREMTSLFPLIEEEVTATRVTSKMFEIGWAVVLALPVFQGRDSRVL